MVTSSDFLVIGGGIIGISIARELKRRFSDQSVTVIEKESACGLHASGRNSGVIHAGFYYSADSLKARFTRQGNQALRAYCESRGIPVLPCGKLVVARDASDLPQLDELLRRGQANGVPLQSLSADEAKAIEPRAKTFDRAIFSPSTASADPARVITSLRTDATNEGIVLLTGCAYQSSTNGRVGTSQGELSCGHVVNAAGLYADKIARDFGFSKRYRIVPFKGLYLYSNEPAGSLRTHIYPVPDLRNPFLGVHFTVRADGRIKIGPTALPALWRENYGGWANFNAAEFLETLFREAGLMVSSDFDFKKLALEELKKSSRGQMVNLAAQLAHGVTAGDYRKWGEPGIRAQLFDIETRKLVMDFVIEGDTRSTHVLNAVSPGWTCALPFSEYVVERIAGGAECL
ncbi:MAG: L-2-hydroxyglutarate oxidase [Terrimicrobiaceae bacterium]